MIELSADGTWRRLARSFFTVTVFFVPRAPGPLAAEGAIVMRRAEVQTRRTMAEPSEPSKRSKSIAPLWSRPELTIADARAAVGFESTRVFHRVARSVLGLTPAQLARRAA